MYDFLIITAYFDGTPQELSNTIHERLSDNTEKPFIICADGGYSLAKAARITPDLIIGDFDSIEDPVPDEIKSILLPVEKDDTDTGICIKYALEHHAENILLLGGIGGRLDHTLGNLQLLSSIKSAGKNATIADGKNLATMIENETITIKKKEGYYISLLSFTPVCEKVCIKGVHYPLQDATLTSDFPLGVSNEFTGHEAVVSVATGKLLVILSQ